MFNINIQKYFYICIKLKIKKVISLIYSTHVTLVPEKELGCHKYVTLGSERVKF